MQVGGCLEGGGCSPWTLLPVLSSGTASVGGTVSVRGQQIVCPEWVAVMIMDHHQWCDVFSDQGGSHVTFMKTIGRYSSLLTGGPVSGTWPRNT